MTPDAPPLTDKEIEQLNKNILNFAAEVDSVDKTIQLGLLRRLLTTIDALQVTVLNQRITAAMERLRVRGATPDA